MSSDEGNRDKSAVVPPGEYIELLDSSDGGEEFKHLVTVRVARGTPQKLPLDLGSVHRHDEACVLIVPNRAGVEVLSIDDHQLREIYSARFVSARAIGECSLLVVYDCEAGMIRRFHVLIDVNKGEVVYVRPLL